MFVNRLVRKYIVGLLSIFPALYGQEAAGPPQPTTEDRWSIHVQTTSIGQHHGGFPSLYEGENSLPPHSENRVSLTATAFLAYRVSPRLELVVNPEVAGGKGFGQVTGIAGFTNGEIPRVSGATPKLYPARAYLRLTLPLGPGAEVIEEGVNQAVGARPVCRLTTVVGKFAATDFFDNNTYSHDPRKQFMNWSLMSNGAWDYPADTRGYTIGAYEEAAMRTWSLRFASVMEPTEPNGPTFDTRVARNRGEALEWERRYAPWQHAGALRVLAFANRERAGAYREALRTGGAPDIADTRRNGALKYGFGLNLEQQLSADIGSFGRYGWNDGKTESWAFTEIDRSASGGISVNGRLWRRKADQVGVAAVRNYLSGDHRCFLAAGGLGFIIGDGRLEHYRPEGIVEAYYAWSARSDWTVTLDYQHVQNPAYNADRGPVSVLSLRLHWER